MLTKTYSNIICLTETWIKNVYNTTLVEYKVKLTIWNKGTGGGSGLKAHFETWNSDKFNKCDIDEYTYDHTDIAIHPPILMDIYAKKKKYLTYTFLWDSKIDYLISSEYDPLKLGRGKAGMRRCESEISMSGISTVSQRTTSTSPLKINTKMATMVKPVIDAVMNPDKLINRKKRGEKGVVRKVTRI